MNQDTSKSRSLIANLPFGFAYHQIVANEQGIPIDYIFLEINQAFEEMTGLKRTDVIGRKVTEVLPGIEKSDFDWIGTYGQVALCGKAVRFENFSEPLGRWYEVSAYSDEPGSFIALFRDVSEHKKAEKTLNDSKDLYLSMFENAPFGYQSLDEDGNFLMVNKAWLSILGYQKNEVIGKWFGNFLAPDYVDAFRERFPIFKERGEIHSVFPMVNKKGHQQIIEFEGKISYKTDGGFECTHCVLADITERIEAQKQLQHQLELTQSYLDTTDTIMVILDLVGNVIMLNRYGLEILEFEAAQIIGKNWFATALPQPEGVEQVYPFFQRIMNGDLEPVSFFENDVMSASGKRYTIAWRNNHLLNDKNEISGTLSSGIDITERKQAEEYMWQCQNIVSSTADGIAFLDKNYRYIIVNDAYEEFSGVNREHFLGRSVAEYLGEDVFRRVVKPHFDKCLQGDTVIYQEWFEYPTMGRRFVEITYSPYRDVHNNIAGVLSNTRDITERKMAEEKLQRVNFSIENLSDSIFWVNETGCFTDVNAAACQKLGYTREELLTMSVADIDPNFPRERWVPHWEEMKRCGLKVIETAHRTKSGNMIPMELTIHNQLFVDTPYNAVLGRDITDRKLAEDEINQLNKELEQRVKERTIELEAVNKELASFAYSISHDFRAPLRALNAFSASLSEKYSDQLDEQGLYYLNRINKASLYMSDLVDDLLSLSRITRADVKKQVVDISHLAEEILRELQEAEPERRVTITVEPGLSAKGDKTLLKAVLVNLSDNAWKFSSKEEQADIKVGQTIMDGEDVFFVKDNGVGFNMAYADKLFGAFQRLHGVDEFPGTGIGLASVQRIVSRHGGRIWAESEVGKGATFYFTLKN